jgi:hypothetical protein
LVLAFLFPLLLAFVLLEIAQIIQIVAVELESGFFGDFSRLTPWAADLYASALGISSFTNSVQAHWQRLCAAMAILASPFLLQRGFVPAAAYCLTAGIHYLWVEVTRPGHLLQNVGWTSPEPMVIAWLVLLLAWIALHMWRKTVTPEMTKCLLSVLIILILLRQTDLIAAPLDPLFSLAGVGYLAVGLGWDLLTAGNWANVGSPALPRTSRIFLYLGYVILTAMLVNWAIASHDLTMLGRFTGDAAVTGLSLLGYPFLFTAIYSLLKSSIIESEDHGTTGA